MKKVLAFVLSLALLVTSIPFGVFAADETAELAAEPLTLVPGKNFFTGANVASDFSASWMTSWWTGNQFQVWLVDNSAREVANDGDEHGDYIRFSWDAANDGFVYGTHYPSNTVEGYAIENDRPIFIGFNGRSSKSGYFLIGSNSESELDYKFEKHCFFLARDWTYYSSSITVKESASTLSNYWVRVGATVQDAAQTVDIDDVTIAPYYRFNYVVDGEDYDYAYVAPVNGENGAYITSVDTNQVDAPEKSGYDFIGWSLDGTNVAEDVTLANSDVVLYALFEEVPEEEPEEPEEPEQNNAVPGKNFFTGANAASDFSASWMTSWWTGGQMQGYLVTNEQREVMNDGDERGDYIRFSWDAANDGFVYGTHYPSSTVEGYTIENDRPIFIGFNGRSSHSGYFLVGSNSESELDYEFSKHCFFLANDWTYYSSSATIKESACALSNYWVRVGATMQDVAQTVDIDDVTIAPYYRIDYYVNDELYDYAYVSPVNGRNGTYLTSADVNQVDAPEMAGYSFVGWSLDGEEVTDEVSLENEDIILYAIFEEAEDDDEPEVDDEIIVPSGAKVGDPGINMYTGNAKKYDFEKSAVGDIDSNVEFGAYGGAEQMYVVKDGSGKHLYISMPSGGNSHYAYLRTQPFESTRPITVAFDAKGTATVNVLNLACDVQLMPSATLTSDWKTYSTKVDASEGTIILHAFSGEAYIDNVYIAADYKFNYYVGGSLYESVYVSPLEDDGALSLDKSVYQIDDPVKPGYTFAGWSLTEGGETTDTVRLGCKDVTLYAVWHYEGTLPGMNVLTDDNTHFDFEDGNQGYVNFDGASQYVGDGVLGTEGNGAWYVYMTRPQYSLTGYGRPVAISFKFKEEFENHDDFVQIIGNGVWEGTQTYSPTTEWQTAHYLADTANAANLSDPSFILYAVAGSGQLYFDDFVFAPAYCFTLFVDGKEYKTEFVSPLSDDGDFLESYIPEFEAPEKEGYKFMGWSLSPSSDAVECVALSNEDIVLYAVYELDENYYLGEGEPMAFEKENKGAYGRLIYKQDFENISSLNTFVYDESYEGIEKTYAGYPDEDTKAILTLETSPLSGLDKSLKLIGKSNTPTFRITFPEGLTKTGEYTFVFYSYKGDETANPKVAFGVNDCQNPTYTNMNTSSSDMKVNKFTLRVVTDEEFEESGLSSSDYTLDCITHLNYIDLYLKDGNGKSIYIDNVELWYNEYADATLVSDGVEVSHVSVKPGNFLPTPEVPEGYMFLGWSEEEDGEDYTKVAKAGTYTYYPVIKSLSELGLSDKRGYEVIKNLKVSELSEINDVDYLDNIFPTDDLYEKALTLAKAGIIGADFSLYEYVTLDELSAIDERMSDESARLSYSHLEKKDTLIYDSEGITFTGDFIAAPDSYLATLNDYPEPTLELGKWIYPAQNTRLYLRHDFKVSKNLVKAEMEFQSDNDFDIYINNVLYTTLGDGKINTSGVVDITDSVVNGTNKLGIRLFHTNTPDRFLTAIRGAIKLTYEDGSVQYVKTETNGKWKFNLVIGYYTNVEPENWQTSSSLATPLYYEYESDLHPSEIKRSVYLRNSFDSEKNVKKATLYAAALGEYVPYINGERVNEGRFLSGSMEQVTEYQAYDVTDFMTGGENVLAVQLGNGWLNNEGPGISYWNKNAIIMQLEIEYNDGTKKTVKTDENWLVTASPLYEDDLMFGERYDARNEIENWNNVGADLSDWVEVDAISINDTPDYIRQYYSYVWASKSDSDVLPDFAPSDYPAVKGTEEHAKKMGTYADTAVYYDFGTNTAGRAKIVLKNTKPGEKIIIRYAEDMGEDENMPYNEVYGDVWFVKDTREGGRAFYSARNIDTYICKGAEEEVWIPEFAYTGFRYVYVYGYSGEFTLDTVRRVEMHTDLEQNGDITTSHEGISKIWDAVKRSYKSNIMTGPTDCPTREKNQWNGDIQVFVNTACWFMDNEKFLGTWTKSGRKIQYDVYGWEDEEYVLPLALYKFYGNKDIIEEKYPVVQALIAKREKQNGGVKFPSGATYSPYNDHMSTMKVSADFYSAAFYCYMYKSAAEMAEILGKTDDANKYRATFETLRKQFNDLYYEADNNDYDQHCQGGIVIPMAFGLCDEDAREGLAETLHDYVVAADYHSNSGFTSAEYLYGILCDYGYAEDALKMLTNETYPSLLYMLGTGATTTTETWNGMYAHSFESANHYAFGNVARWFFEYLGGINITSAGFESVTIKPYFFKELGDLKAEYNSRRGLIVSEWKYNESTDTYEWTVTVPEGVEAKLVTPDGTEFSLTNATETYVVNADGSVGGLVEIDIGEKASETNVRFAEINGIQTKIAEKNNIFAIQDGEENLLIEITEKESEDSAEIVKTQYFYFNAESKSVTKLNMDSYMAISNMKSIRLKEPMGIRFKSQVATSAKYEETEYEIAEYGYVIARKDVLGNTELTLDFDKKVVGVAYNKQNGTDIIFENVDEYDVFTCFVKNIPVQHYATDLVCKVYTKVNVGGEEFILYSEPVIGNPYDTAKKLLKEDAGNEELLKIIFDYENTIGLPGDDLFD